ncbi:E3 ubiquitin-protein ligase TRIM56-like isoform X2 [Ptychodera flava]|uniref:E3 ubiquitin-protein ligase TRIM56-like isoform X2 n=1 Tax=Ptychodera flava TaxID=63121 RepID=UPI003969CC08
MAEGGEPISGATEKLMSEIDDKILLCPICMDRFTSPKILPCFHTFCQKCLTDWVQKKEGRLVCPNCKQQWPLPPAGASKIDNNRFLNDLIEVITNFCEDSKKPSCEICQKEAKVWCKDCGQYFCADECLKAHRVVRSLIDHQLMTIEEYNEKINSPHFRVLQPRFCDKHTSTPLDYYCDSCQALTCLKCLVVEHPAPEHKVISIDKALEKYTPQLEGYLTTVEEKISQLKQATVKTNEVLSNLEENRAKSESEINAMTEKIQNEVKREGERLLSDLQGMYKPKRRQIDDHIDVLDFKRGCAESVHSYLSNIMKYGGPVDVMSAKKDIDRHIGEQAKEKETPVKLSSGITFEENVDHIPIHLGCLKSDVALEKTPGQNGSRKGHQRRGSREEQQAAASPATQSVYSQVVATIVPTALKIPGNEPKTAIEGAVKAAGIDYHYKSDGKTILLQGSLEQVTQVNTKLCRLQRGVAKENLPAENTQPTSLPITAMMARPQSPNVGGNNVKGAKTRPGEEGKGGPMIQRLQSVPEGYTAGRPGPSKSLPSSRSLGDLSDDGKGCRICFDDIKDPRALPCNHSFCKACIDQQEKRVGPRCPVCNKSYGTRTGNMPPGEMTHVVQKGSLPGYISCNTIVITYNFKAGTQGAEHPNPGKPYQGTTRTAYLPDNAEGREVLKLLRIAFDRRLTFTIDTSRTTGRRDSIVWNDIRHKTGEQGGAEGYGYPDPGYLARVKDELAALGVK